MDNISSLVYRVLQVNSVNRRLTAFSYLLVNTGLEFEGKSLHFLTEFAYSFIVQ